MRTACLDLIGLAARGVIERKIGGGKDVMYTRRTRDNAKGTKDYDYPCSTLLQWLEWQNGYFNGLPRELADNALRRTNERME